MAYYVKITNLSLGTGYIQESNQLGALIDEIQEAIKEAEYGGYLESWGIEIIEMDPEEYSSLPEFDGY